MKAFYLFVFQVRFALTELMRDTILKRFRSHLDDFGKDEFEFPHHKATAGGLTVYISKKDRDCGGTMQPYYHLSFEVPDARPIDVFNTLADITKQSQWLCSGCTIEMLKKDMAEKVHGLTATYRTGLLLRREFYQWAASDADFENETFLTGVVGDNRTDELKAIRSPLKDAIVATMCYSFSYITPSAKGAHVIQMSHFDANIPEMPFGLSSPRNLYSFIWPIMVSRIPRIISHSQDQAVLKWPLERIVISPEYLDIPASGPQAYQRSMPSPNESSVVLARAETDDDRNEFSLPIVALILASLTCCCLVMVLCCCCSSKTARGAESEGDSELGSSDAENCE